MTTTISRNFQSIKDGINVPSNYDGPGLYRHYKGGRYLAEGLVTIEATGELAVLYQPITPEGRVATARDFVTMRYIRPLADFNESTMFGDEMVPRFVRISV